MGHDSLWGEDGTDLLRGWDGDERNVYWLTWEDNDNLHGGNGHDDLNGGSYHDYLFGQLGNDRLEGDFNAARDTFWGDNPYSNIRSADQYVVYRHRYNGQWLIDETERNLEMDDRDSIIHEAT